MNYKDHDWKSNLVSKVRNLTCNSIKDTLSRRRFNALDTIHKIIYKTQYISNHERYYYDISTTDDSTHTFRRVTHAQDHLMTGIAFVDLAKEIIELYKVIKG